MTKKGRILTSEQVREAKPCAEGYANFRKLWGNKALINQEWAKQVADSGRFLVGDMGWLAHNFLPDWAFEIYLQVGDPYLEVPSYYTWVHVNAAIFAALYMETQDD